jgi:hypothetical protein
MNILDLDGLNPETPDDSKKPEESAQGKVEKTLKDKMWNTLVAIMLVGGPVGGFVMGMKYQDKAAGKDGAFLSKEARDLIAETNAAIADIKIKADKSAVTVDDYAKIQMLLKDAHSLEKFHEETFGINVSQSAILIFHSMMSLTQAEKELHELLKDKAVK